MICLWAVASVLIEPAQADPLQVVVARQDTDTAPRFKYYTDLLSLALNKTEGAFEIRRYPQFLTQGRTTAKLVQDQGIDVIWTMASKERLQTLRPIRISLLRGLNSHRAFIIRENDKDRFAAIETLEQLRRLTAGQGSHWPDSDVLRQNHIKVVESTRLPLLFRMLEGGRLDYIPLGLYEVWGEYRHGNRDQLMIEPRLTFRYPAPIYFFVNKNNKALAERIETGLKRALEDGSFEKLLMEVPSARYGMKELLCAQRQVFNLTSPLDGVVEVAIGFNDRGNTVRPDLCDGQSSGSSDKS